jgi:hypothetical protein
LKRGKKKRLRRCKVILLSRSLICIRIIQNQGPSDINHQFQQLRHPTTKHHSSQTKLTYPPLHPQSRIINPIPNPQTNLMFILSSHKLIRRVRKCFKNKKDGMLWHIWLVMLRGDRKNKSICIRELNRIRRWSSLYSLVLKCYLRSLKLSSTISCNQ